MGSNKVISINDISSKFNINNAKSKCNKVIIRINNMINNKDNFNKSTNKNLTINKIKTIENNNKKWIFPKELLAVMVVILVLGFSLGYIIHNNKYLKDKVKDYESHYYKITEKLDTNINTYQDIKKYDNKIDTSAASELVDCINSPIDIDKLPSSVTNVINEINEYYNQSNDHFAFKYKDIYSGFSVSYNEEQEIFAASCIKAPKDIYIYEMASEGKINLDDILTYTDFYYNDGSGVLKDNEFNTSYDVRTLVNYSTIYSDNAAHNMLMDKYGIKNMLNYWKKIGTDIIFTGWSNWGNFNAHDASIYMEELYDFYIENKDYGSELMNNFINNPSKFITGKNNYKVANKSGWDGSVVHDVSIVFADNPYIVVALSNLGERDNAWGYFNKVNNLAYKLHTEYWKYKMSMCSDINQY